MGTSPRPGAKFRPTLGHGDADPHARGKREYNLVYDGAALYAKTSRFVRETLYERERRERKRGRERRRRMLSHSMNSHESAKVVSGGVETSSSCGHRGVGRSAGKTPKLTLEEMQRRSPMIHETRWFENRRNRRGGREGRGGADRFSPLRANGTTTTARRSPKRAERAA